MLMEVIWLRSRSGETEREFPFLEMAAEGDQEDDWRWALTSIERREIVLAPCLPEEVDLYDGLKPEQPGCLRFQERINRLLNRHDLRSTWRFISAADWATAPHARAVCDFPEIPVVGYMDIYSPGRHAEEVRRETVDAFVHAGGVLTNV